MFEDVIKLWKNGLMQTRTIHLGDDVASKYVYMTIPPKYIQSSSTIKLVVAPHGKSGPVQMYVEGKGNPKPTSRRNKHLFKTKTIHAGKQGVLMIDVGSAYGVKVIHVGVKCLDTSAAGQCKFDIFSAYIENTR